MGKFPGFAVRSREPIHSPALHPPALHSSYDNESGDSMQKIFEASSARPSVSSYTNRFIDLNKTTPSANGVSGALAGGQLPVRRPLPPAPRARRYADSSRLNPAVETSQPSRAAGWTRGRNRVGSKLEAR